jgi:WD40 repeat protein
MGHRVQEFLPFGRIIDLGEFLRQIQVRRLRFLKRGAYENPVKWLAAKIASVYRRAVSASYDNTLRVWDLETEGASFWKVKHGIRFTAMPSFTTTLQDEEIWKIAMFLKQMDKLPPTVDAEWKKVPSVAATQPPK